MSLEIENRTSAEQQAINNANLVNTELAKQYENAMAAYVVNNPRRVALGLTPDPIPLPAYKVRFVLAPFPDNTLMVISTNEPVSTKVLDDFLPKFGTDVNAIGGPVGGLIPGTSNQYYMASDDKTPVGGQPYVSSKGVFVKVQENPFKTYWLKVA